MPNSGAPAAPKTATPSADEDPRDALSDSVAADPEKLEVARAIITRAQKQNPDQ